jgi:hypothetical protein
VLCSDHLASAIFKLPACFFSILIEAGLVLSPFFYFFPLSFLGQRQAAATVFTISGKWLRLALKVIPVTCVIRDESALT